ncbi:myb DNA binding domain-containing protein [Naegleria gruberi]|uniref:Myb DNA binding domain-containing protein n=1 Tax=Naegleria gruberi TaxID=5762 RepID=D2VR55_NAEGR|nr:myb DNA binding domain-containing protein [Naegleria gruberi]EFC40837.1 myb DNA binding domain-containing protein [Naegleria gruberi]|eukprot:XP_002673581.1 myb DNA binding domain-containing protein [Naegleria gruberi strain NEG-M]
MVKSSRTSSPTGLNSGIEISSSSITPMTITSAPINMVLGNTSSVLYSSLNHTTILLQQQQQQQKAMASVVSTMPPKKEPEEDFDIAALPRTPINSITKTSKTKRKNSASKSSTKPPKVKSEPTSPTDDGANGKRKSCNRWTKNENELLLKAIEKYGEKKWNEIAKMVATKNSDQCNQHWWRVLNPKICKKPWNEEEDNILIDKVREFGESAWKSIADSFQGRTDIQCRHRWIMLRKYEQEGKGRPISRTNITCNSNVPIPEKLKDTLETEAKKSSSSSIQSRKKRSVSNVSSTDSHLSNEGDLLCNEDPFQMITTSTTSQQQLIIRPSSAPLIKSEKRQDFDIRNAPISLEDDLVDESVYNFDQQEILLCEGSAIVPYECKLDVASPTYQQESYDETCFDNCQDEDEFIRREIEIEERMFNLQSNGVSTSDFSDDQMMILGGRSDPSKELANVFAEWNDFVCEFMPVNDSRSSSRQSYLSDTNFDGF